MASSASVPLFDTRVAVQTLQDRGGLSAPAADAIVDVVKGATSDLVTTAILNGALSRERVWIISGFFTANAAMAALILGFIQATNGS